MIVNIVGTAFSLQSALKTDWGSVIADPQTPAHDVTAKEVTLPIGTAMLISFTTSKPFSVDRLYTLIQDGRAYIIAIASPSAPDKMTGEMSSFAQRLEFTKPGRSTGPAVPSWVKNLKPSPTPNPKSAFTA